MNGNDVKELNKIASRADSIAIWLESPVRPGHPEYISKKNAAAECRRLSERIIRLIALLPEAEP